ncbi:MAG: TerB family tellurite resistance protein [Bacteroidales bacterium]|nr:TerB family tellurite resistance protein [Bacteroidales bacterium]
MGAFKWLAGLLGWVSWGPIGGLLGYFAGAFVERSLDAARRLGTGSGPFGSPDSDFSSAGGFGSADSGYSSGGYSSGSRQYSATEQRNSFMVSLLVLSSAVIKADGRVHPAEVEFALSFVRQNFGEGAVPQARQILEELNRKEVNVYSVGGQIADNMNYSQRLQLYHYLARIANADGLFSKEEKDVLEAIASAIRITSSDAASVIAMFYKDTGSSYAVLEVSPSATDDEIKKAYRRMAMKYHPDKVSTLGPDVQRAAAEKFRQVQEAYETIKRQRGMN